MSIERFADQLRRSRLAAGLTQEDLAERSGLSVRGISDLERGVKQRPHPETIRLLAAALDLPPESLASFKASAASRSAIEPAAMPEPLTPLVDREDDVRFVATLVLPDSGLRLVTLTGPGGVGKTRLAIDVARVVRGEFADGVAFVALAGLSDPSHVLAAMAKSLGIRELPGRALLELLSRQLQEPRMLVVMDNFEHLLAAATDIAELLARCRGLSMLATSRAPLHVTGEQEYPVRPLELPDPARQLPPAEIAQIPAISLFVQRAQAVQPQFRVTEGNAAAVVATCARVDGLPLALELAAVRMKTLAPKDLESLLGNRLGILTGGPQDHPTRHRTMRSTIGWSHDLMPPGEQVAFRRFAVFVSGATLESAAVVVSDGNTLETLDHLTALMDQSLVQRYEGPDGHPRFVMLETIREYAMEQLAASGDDIPVRDLHAAHFLQLAEQGEAELTGPHQAAWMTRLESEYGNLRAALGWTIARGDAESSQRLGSALWRFWAASGRLREGRDWLDQALALEANHVSAIRARALLRRGNIAVDLADYPAARSMYESSLSLSRKLGDEVAAGRALDGLGLVLLSQGDYAGARAAYESTLKVWRALEAKREVALVLFSLGKVAMAEGDLSGARKVFDTSLSIRRDLGDTGGAAWGAFWRGRMERLEGKTDNAHRWLSRAQAGFLEVDDRLGATDVLNELGRLAHELGDNQLALAHHLDALREGEEDGAFLKVVESLEGIAAVVLSQKQLELGVTIMAAASVWRQMHGVPPMPALWSTLEYELELARTALPTILFERATAEGETASLDEVIDLAFSVSL